MLELVVVMKDLGKNKDGKAEYYFGYARPQAVDLAYIVHRIATDIQREMEQREEKRMSKAKILQEDDDEKAPRPKTQEE